jgi:hypothetical protein
LPPSFTRITCPVISPHKKSFFNTYYTFSQKYRNRSMSFGI